MQMVNAGFPSSIRYGFERVDARQAAFRRENRHQLKIYTESNQSHFWRIFVDLSVTQTLAIYRQLLAKERLTRTTRQERLVKT
jgi:anti-sigma-K factor RskA